MKRILRSTILAALLAFAMPAFANDDSLSFALSSSGVVSVVISIPQNTCSGGFVPNTYLTSVSVVGNQVDISSEPIRADPGGPPCLDDTYSSSLVLGTFSDGVYNVIWSFGPEIVLGQFVLRAGSLRVTQNPVPSLGCFAEACLVLLVLCIAVLNRKHLVRRVGPNYSFNATVMCRGDYPAPGAAR